MGNVALGIAAEKKTIQTSITDEGWEDVYKSQGADIPRMGSASLADCLSREPATKPCAISVKINPLESYDNKEEPYTNNKDNRDGPDKDWICKK